MSVDLGLFVAIAVLVARAGARHRGAEGRDPLFPIAILFGYCGRADAALFARRAVAGRRVRLRAVRRRGAALLPPRDAWTLLNAGVAAVDARRRRSCFILYRSASLAPRLPRAPRAPDAIDEGNPVIVAGFGRFGQVVARVLRGLGIGATLIDHDPEPDRAGAPLRLQGLLRRRHAPRPARARPASRAPRLLVVALDDQEAALQIGAAACARPLSAACRSSCARTAAPTPTSTSSSACPRCARPSARRSTPPSSRCACSGTARWPRGASCTQFRRHDEEITGRWRRTATR